MGLGATLPNHIPACRSELEWEAYFFSKHFNFFGSKLNIFQHLVRTKMTMIIVQHGFFFSTDPRFGQKQNTRLIMSPPVVVMNWCCVIPALYV